MNTYQLLPSLSDEDYQRLRTDIAERGIMVPVEVDEDGNVLDGHHRMRIAAELGIKCPTIVRKDMAEYDKRIHAVMLNLARRQLTDAQKVMLGERIEPDITERARVRQIVLANTRPTQNLMDKCPEGAETSTTRDEVAEVVGLGSGRTYDRNKKIIEEARQMAEESPEVAEVLEAAERGEADMPDIRKAIKPHVANNSGHNEWYTPPEYIEAARKVMGGIDLDPASSEVAQRTVQAGSYYSKDDDGLTQPWSGRVWMNPPYAQPLIGQFIERLVGFVESGEVTQAIVLVNNGTETKWGQALLRSCSAVCFPTGRVRFLDPEGNLGAPLQGQMVVYLGSDCDVLGFAEAFAEFGSVLMAEDA
jgi:ParB-like chromosome segregation protein Spo0J